MWMSDAVASSFKIYCCDVGSTREENFGWACVSRASTGASFIYGGHSIGDCAACIKGDLAEGAVVTLGFESPLFLPIPRREDQLGCGRLGESSRSCFASVGSSVATLGLHQLAFLLTSIRQPNTILSLDWQKWNASRPRELLLWEAFVSGPAHTTDGDHRRDAATAAWSFAEMYQAGPLATAVEVSNDAEVFSLVGAAALSSGWVTAPRVLRTPVLVLKPGIAYSGDIHEF